MADANLPPVFTVTDAMVLCGFNKANSTRVAADVFNDDFSTKMDNSFKDDDFFTMMDKSFKDLNKDMKTYSSLTTVTEGHIQVTILESNKSYELLSNGLKMIESERAWIQAVKHSLYIIWLS